MFGKTSARCFAKRPLHLQHLPDQARRDQRPSRRTRRRRGHGLPYEGWLRPVRPLERPPRLEERVARPPKSHLRSGGEFPLRRQARRVRKPASGQSDHEDGHPLERPPKDRQHPLCAVRRPRRDGPPVGFAECLRRGHRQIFSAATSSYGCSSHRGLQTRTDLARRDARARSCWSLAAHPVTGRMLHGRSTGGSAHRHPS